MLILFDRRGDDVGIVGHAVQRVHEVHERRVAEPGEHRVVAGGPRSRFHCIWGIFGPGRDPAHGARDDAEPGGVLRPPPTS